ncbi:unnamed protein product [Closterium sp. NIES-54]
MEVGRISIIHAASLHFLWSFVVRYAAHQLNLWPHVSELETSPTLRWTGKVGNAYVFRVWGSLALVHDTNADKVSSRTIRCVTPPPLVEPLEVSSDPIGPAKGGDLAADDTAASWRSPRLEASPGFPPRPSSPPLQPVAMDPGAAGGGDTKGTGFGRPTGGGVEGALAGGSAGALQSLRQRPLYWEQQQSSLPFLESMAGGTRDGGTGAGGAGGYGAGSTAAKGT